MGGGQIQEIKNTELLKFELLKLDDTCSEKWNCDIIQDWTFLCIFVVILLNAYDCIKIETILHDQYTTNELDPMKW